MPRISAKAAKAQSKSAALEPEAAPGVTPAADCPLCGRPLVPGPTTDEHHLVPRSQRGREKFLVHRICHTKIHATISEKRLAAEYHTWEALRAHPQIAAFIAWVQKKPPEFMARNARAHDKR
ncbi:MAG: restriction endonuclease [Betaproteobacteria bacterium]|nr:restriction endonuclease [Betaproteobacteria bacterium]